MDYPIRTLSSTEFPPLLREIPDAPASLTIRGTLPPHEYRCLTVVGSRDYTTYGKQVAERLIEGLRGYPVSIVSGLALGIDSIAHRAALRAGLHTIAVPGSGLNDNVLYPRSHRALAMQILESGGALLSEFEPSFASTPWCFPQRNRIVAGISHATLVIEAGLRSGTLITARLATDYNRDVCTVPGSIFSSHSDGPHMLIRLGAVPIRTTEDILEVLDLAPHAATQPSVPTGISDDERRVLNFLSEPQHKESVIVMLDMPASSANALLSMMEIQGYVEERGGIIHRLV